MKRKAFTLVELLVVIAIIGVVVGILIPIVTKVWRGTSTPERVAPVPTVTARPPVEVVPKTTDKGEVIPMNIHGNKYVILYYGPDDVKIFRQKDAEDESTGTTDRAGNKKPLPH